MEKDHTLSKEALQAIEHLESHLLNFDRDAYFALLLFLYEKQPFAKEAVLSLFETSALLYISIFLTEEEISVLQREFREVARFCVSSMDWRRVHMSRNKDSFIIPREVVDLFTTMVSPALGSKVLLPYSCPEIYAYLSNEYKCYGYVTSTDTQKEWAFSQMLSDAFNVDAKISACRFNENHIGSPRQYDYIFAFPPIRISGKEISEELTLMAKDYLKDNGEMFCVLPYEFTCKLEWENLRKTIVDACFEIKVITLRTSMCRGREICVIHLKKTHTGNITLVDGTQLFMGNNFCVGSPKSEAEYPIEAIERDKGDYVWHGGAKDIKDYDLRPAIYLLKLPIPQEGERLVEMRELVEVIECDNDVSDLDAERKYKVIEPMDLVGDYTHCSIGLEDLTYSKNVTSLLTSDALLFNEGGYVAKFSHKGENVGLGRRIIPFRLKGSDIISEEFLLRALTLKETLEQVKSYERSLGSIGLAEKDFLKLVIIIPSIKQQEQLVADDKKIWEIQHETIEEKDKRYQQMIWLNETHIRNSKHTLNGHIIPIHEGLKQLHEFFQDNPNGVRLSSVIGNVGNTIIDVEYLLKVLERSAYRISEDIDNLTKSEEGEEVKLNVSMEINSYCDTLTSRYGPRFRVERVGMDKELYVWIRRTSFFDLLDNIVDNAVRHGFVEDKTDYKVCFRVETTDERMCRISIKNNGKPMSERALKIYFERGSFAGKTGHTGIGGSEIYKICDKAGGRALQPYNKDGYVVISVELPLVEREK